MLSRKDPSFEFVRMKSCLIRHKAKLIGHLKKLLGREQRVADSNLSSRHNAPLSMRHATDRMVIRQHILDAFKLALDNALPFSRMTTMDNEHLAYHDLLVDYHTRSQAVGFRSVLHGLDAQLGREAAFDEEELTNDAARLQRISGLTNKQLSAQLKSRGLAVSGVKRVLVERLWNAMRGDKEGDNDNNA